MITTVEKVSKIKGISERKTIFIVDNNLINRAKLRNQIRLSSKYLVIGESEYCNYYDKVCLINPNVLIFSSFSNFAINESIILSIRKDFPLLKILVITNDFDEKEFLQAVNAGVCGYLSAESSFEEIVYAIDEIINYGACFDKRLNRFIFRVMNAMCENLKTNHFDKSPDEQYSLTRRELEVASVMSESAKYSDVALKLHISQDTVKMHMSHIYKKLGVSTKHEAILKLQSKILEFKLNSSV